ncbi:MAG TPA: RDD family protein [Arthrobacter sp.]|nr:RDD family protein [Arthrobacter sp.]
MSQISKEPGRPANTRVTYPALEGVSPASAGAQISSKILDAIIVGIPVLVLSFLGLAMFVLFLVSMMGIASKPPGDETSEDIIAAYAGPVLGPAAVWLLTAIFLIGLLAIRGSSTGNAMLGLRLVSTADGQPIGWGKALLWYTVVVVGSVLTYGILGLLFLLSPLFDTESGWHQAWPDKMVGAVMINRKMGPDTIKH